MCHTPSQLPTRIACSAWCRHGYTNELVSRAQSSRTRHLWLEASPLGKAQRLRDSSGSPLSISATIRPAHSSATCCISDAVSCVARASASVPRSSIVISSFIRCPSPIAITDSVHTLLTRDASNGSSSRTDIHANSTRRSVHRLVVIGKHSL